MKRRLFLGLISTLLLAPAALCLPPNPDFSGTWKQSNQRCVPNRTGIVTLHIDHRDPDLIVETTILGSSRPPRSSVQRYRTDGKTTVSTGADGDEFHTSIVWIGPSLVFSVEEHENGNILLSRETWTLLENGSALERRRERRKNSQETETQTLIYLRETPNL